MNLWEDIKESADSIKEDFELGVFRSKKDRQQHPINYIGSRSKPESDAMFNMMIPHIIGFIIGLAAARIFRCAFIGYMIFGAIFGCLTGAYKSYAFDKISWKYALIKNALLSAIYIAVFIFMFIMSLLMR